MSRLVKPLAIVLAVPVLCTLMALAARDRLDQRWQAGLRREFILHRQPVNEKLVARYSLGALCSDRRTAATIRPCRPYALFTSVASASFVVGAFGLLVLGAIALGGMTLRGRPGLAVRVFTPAIYAVIACVVLLVLLDGALGIAGLYMLGEVIQRWPVSIVFAAAAAAVLALLSMIQLSLRIARKASTAVLGRELAPEAQRGFFAAVADTARAVGSVPPDNVVAGLAPRVFLTRASVLTLDGRTRGRTLYVSPAIARVLRVEELQGLLAHELSHFSGEDANASSLFYPSYVGARHAIEARRRTARGIRALATLPVVWVVSFFLDWFAPVESRVGAERELRADRQAAGLVGPAVLASALVKIHAFAPAWDVVLDAMERAVASGTQYENASELFANVVAQNATPERLAGLGSQRLSHPTDSLPPLGVRLAALGVDVPAVLSAALATSPAQPAVSLFDHHEALERDLSEVEHRLLALTRRQYEDDLEPADRSSV